MPPMARVAGLPAASTERRPTVGGKYLYAGGRKLYVRGVTYGPFAPDEVTGESYDPEFVDRDFAAMAKHGMNAVRVYTVPPRDTLQWSAVAGTTPVPVSFGVTRPSSRFWPETYSPSETICGSIWSKGTYW